MYSKNTFRHICKELHLTTSITFIKIYEIYPKKLIRVKERFSCPSQLTYVRKQSVSCRVEAYTGMLLSGLSWYNPNVLKQTKRFLSISPYISTALLVLYILYHAFFHLNDTREYCNYISFQRMVFPQCKCKIVPFGRCRKLFYMLPSQHYALHFTLLHLGICCMFWSKYYINDICKLNRSRLK